MSWKNLHAAQQPKWPDANELRSAASELQKLPALVFAGETRTLKKELADAEKGDALILQCGDCAEEFSNCNGISIHRMLKVILQMSAILAYVGQKKIIRIGRIAGQYAKPRTSDVELLDGVEIPSYRGDMVNGFTANLVSRMPNPRRMIEGYFRAAATLNLIRAFTRGGYAAWDLSENWHDGFTFSSAIESKYQSLTNSIRQSFRFINSLGVDLNSPLFNEVALYTSHEALLLDYEDALTRIDTTTQVLYNAGAHMVWIGERTRQPHGAHVEYASTIANPVGIKLGPNCSLQDLKLILDKINPKNESGKIVLITRLGAMLINDQLPLLIETVKHEGYNVIWSCDPMHGNTYLNKDGIKTRDFSKIMSELKSFFNINKQLGSVAGGVHLEITGDDVTECVGGVSDINDDNLTMNYQTTCDPRLNATQSLEIAFELAGLLSGNNTKNLL
jgi:3-deoxy-7-phosphoheptulonate synthase